MLTKLHWLDGAWPGRLAISARPRGGDWLSDEIAGWKRAGLDVVLSLLTPEEEKDLDLRDEGRLVRESGLQFRSFPIPDRQVPDSEARFAQTLETLSATLAAGKNVVVHCRQGFGRSGLVAASLLVNKGMSPGAAVESASAARGVPIPETNEQRDWIDRYAAVFSGAKSY